MTQDITALKQSFEEEYRAFLVGDSGKREFRQGELFDKYRQLEISSKDMAKIIQSVDSETQDKTSKLESYVRRINNCIKEFKSRSDENLEQENINESIAENTDTANSEQSGENSVADSDKSEVEIQLENLRDEINKHDQNIADNVIAVGDKLLEAKDCVKKIKHLKWQDWLARNIKMPRQTANKYMNCTERFKNVSLAGHFDLSKMNVTQMFELLSVPKDKLEQFFMDVESKNITIQDKTKNELRDLIKDWKQNNIVSDKITKKKIAVRLTLAEDDRDKFTEFLQYILSERKLSDDSLKSVESAIKSLTMAVTTEVGETESGIVEE